MATTLMTTPETMWSTLNVTVASACTIEKISPDPAPISNPAVGPYSIVPQAPMTVPMIMIPSRPMLTIPERSLNSPPSAAR